MLNISNNSSEQPDGDRLSLLDRLVQNHPLIFWGLLGTLILSTGGFAMFRLLNPGPIEPDTSAPTPTASTVQETPATPFVSKPASSAFKELHKFTDQQDLPPLSLIGAVALGCAGGSLLITQALRQTSNRRQAIKRSKLTPNGRKKRQSLSKKRRPTATRQPVAPKPTLTTLENRGQATVDPSTQITVLPPEESHPLDGGNQSLAEQMDLRKRQSLASLMRGR